MLFNQKKDIPIGYCMLKDIKTYPKIGIMIDEKYQGYGYGTKTMELLHKKAKELGCKRLGLMVRVGNKAAINLYKRFNYKITNYIMEVDI